jgi:short-subunit dehydrogenase
MVDKNVCLILGAGSGIGLAAARKFGLEGFKIIVSSRSVTNVESLVRQLMGEGIDADGLALDCAGPGEVTRAVRALGSVEVLIYNAAGVTMATPMNLKPDQLLQDFSVSAASALAASQAVFPEMKTRGRGSIMLTGGGFALRPSAAMASLGIGKAALRNLAFSLADELRPEGIRVGTVTILGMVKTGTPFDPEKIADVFWSLHEDRAYALGAEVQFSG